VSLWAISFVAAIEGVRVKLLKVEGVMVKWLSG
jgi:hypothetical protein